IVDKIWKKLETCLGRCERHRVAIRKWQRPAAVIEIRMDWGLPELVQHLMINYCQIDQCGVAEIQIGAWQLFEISLDHWRLFFRGTEAHIETHTRNTSEMDMRVDEAGNKKQSLPGNDCRADRLLRRWSSFHAGDASACDQHVARRDMIEILWRDDGDVCDPGWIRRLTES